MEPDGPSDSAAPSMADRWLRVLKEMDAEVERYHEEEELAYAAQCKEMNELFGNITRSTPPPADLPYPPRTFSANVAAASDSCPTPLEQLGEDAEISDGDMQLLFDLYNKGRTRQQTQLSADALPANPDYLVTSTLDKKTGGTKSFSLQDYQREGAGYMFAMYKSGHTGAFLADEQGLGKTLQVIVLIQEVIRKRKFDGLPAKPSLVIVPDIAIGRDWKRQLQLYGTDI